MSDAKAEKPEKKKKRKGSLLSTLVMIFGSIGLIIVFHTGFIFFVSGIMPSIVAFYIDRTPRRTTFHTVFACNLSGIIPFMAQLLRDGNSSGAATDMMGDAGNWLIIYASAGFGWILVYAAPLFAQFLISMFHQGQIMRFESMQDRIINDWGNEVSNFFPSDKSDDY